MYTSNRSITLISNNRDINCPNVCIFTTKLAGNDHKNAADRTLSEEVFCKLLMCCWSVPNGIKENVV